MRYVRPLTAEFLGTFAFVFFGAGAIVTNQASGGALGVLGIALAHAFALGVMVAALMRISGAHFNPAVTLALFLTNKCDARTSASYVGTQLVAAAAAALLLKALLPAGPGEVASYGVPQISGDIDLIGAVLLEAIMTFFLVCAMLGAVTSGDSPAAGGIGVGLVYAFAILVGGPLTGAALNPARAFGPALVAGSWYGHAAYWIGPLVGGAAAALIWGQILLSKDQS